MEGRGEGGKGGSGVHKLKFTAKRLVCLMSNLHVPPLCVSIFR